MNELLIICNDIIYFRCCKIGVSYLKNAEKSADSPNGCASCAMLKPY